MLLDGFTLDHDALLWIPSLEAFARNDWETVIPENDALRTLGTMAIAKLGIAAVEQYQEAKKLNEGSVEKLRAIAAFLFIDMSNRAAMVNGQCDVLAAMRMDFPGAPDWRDKALTDLTANTKAVRSEAAGKVLGLLREIQNQQLPKKRGNQGDRPKGLMSEASAEKYDLAITQIINVAAQTVKARSPLEPATYHMIRPEIRNIVKGAVFAGQIVDDPEYDVPTDEKHLVGLVEVVTRRALRRFDRDAAQFVKEGKLIGLHP